MLRAATFIAVFCFVSSAFSQDEYPVIGMWQCVTRDTARDSGRTVGIFRGTATLRLHADKTVTGTTVPGGDRSQVVFAGRWTGDAKRLVLELAGSTMRGNLVQAKLLLGSSATGNREASVSTSWTCTNLAEAEH